MLHNSEQDFFRMQVQAVCFPWKKASCSSYMSMQWVFQQCWWFGGWCLFWSSAAMDLLSVISTRGCSLSFPVKSPPPPPHINMEMGEMATASTRVQTRHLSGALTTPPPHHLLDYFEGRDTKDWSINWAGNIETKDITIQEQSRDCNTAQFICCDNTKYQIFCFVSLVEWFSVCV